MASFAAKIRLVIVTILKLVLVSTVLVKRIRVGLCSLGVQMLVRRPALRMPH